MARWTASAKWAVGPALDGQRDMPLSLRLSEGLGITGWRICCPEAEKLSNSDTAPLFQDPYSLQTEVDGPGMIFLERKNLVQFR